MLIMKTLFSALLILAATPFLSLGSADDIGVTINLKEGFDAIETCERLKIKLNRDDSIALMRSLSIIPTEIPKARISEISQDLAVKNIDFSERCTMIPPQIVNRDIQEKHEVYWGKFRILFKDYPFRGDGSAPKKNPPGYEGSVYESKGKGVDIFVVDTGILSTHNFFQSEGAPRAKLTWSAYQNDATDREGHGTHVAGILAGNHPFGIAQQATLHSIKVLDDSGIGSEACIIKGIEAIIRYKEQHPSNTCAIVNMSMASSDSKSVDKSVEKLIKSGAVVVAAAGNHHTDAGKYSPAKLSSVLTVGASVKYPDTHSKKVIRDSRYGESNFGPSVDLYAPGFFIYSSDCHSPEDASYKTGTSMAAPYVSGVAACVAAAYPQAEPWQIKSFITKYASVPRQVEVNSQEHRKLGALLFACPRATPSLPNDLINPSFSAQSAEDYYEGCFPYGNGSPRLSSSMTQSSTSIGNLCEELKALHLLQQSHNMDIQPTVSEPNVTKQIKKLVTHAGILEPETTTVLGHYIPEGNELLRVYLRQDPDDSANIPFYAAYLEYATLSAPDNWIRGEQKLLTQNGIETYIEIQADKIYRVAVDLYAGTFIYNFEMEGAPVPCLEQDPPPDDLKEEEEYLNVFFSDSAW